MSNDGRGVGAAALPSEEYPNGPAPHSVCAERHDGRRCLPSARAPMPRSAPQSVRARKRTRARASAGANPAVRSGRVARPTAPLQPPPRPLHTAALPPDRESPPTANRPVCAGRTNTPPTTHGEKAQRSMRMHASATAQTFSALLFPWSIARHARRPPRVAGADDRRSIPMSSICTIVTVLGGDRRLTSVKRHIQGASHGKGGNLGKIQTFKGLDARFDGRVPQMTTTR